MEIKFPVISDEDFAKMKAESERMHKYRRIARLISEVVCEIFESKIVPENVTKIQDMLKTLTDERLKTQLTERFNFVQSLIDEFN